MVNADSMQVYSVLHALTARPGVEDLARAPHRLYGHIYPANAYSTGNWLRDVAALADRGVFARRRAIFVGGTGLYFRGLTEGLSQMPEIPPAVRERWRYELHEHGASRLFRILLKEDAKAALSLRQTDGQRIVRALEVLEVSGRSILDWQADGGEPLVDAASARRFIIEPDRQQLAGRIGARFETMVASGGLEEARVIAVVAPDPALPAAKAIGVRELQLAVAGSLSLAEAVERAKIATRQYAKRQATWFRHQCGPEWTRIAGGNVAELLRGIAI